MSVDKYQFDCEVLISFINKDGSLSQKWIVREVALIADGATVRCNPAYANTPAKSARWSKRSC